MGKWEYCVVGPITTDLLPARPNEYVAINNLTGYGLEQPTHLNLSSFSNDPSHYLAQLIWLLGEEEWELVGSGSGTILLPPAIEGGSEESRVSHMLYFKRPKRAA